MSGDLANAAALAEERSAHVDFRNQPWEPPDPLPNELPSVPLFDSALLPATFRPWIADVAERMQCPPEYVGVTAMVAAGSVIGRQAGIRPKRHDDWLVVANLWGLIVGRSGVLKSPAQEEAMRPLHALETEARKVHEDALAGWEARQFARDASKGEVKREIAKARKAGKDTEIIARDFLEDGREDSPPGRRRYVTTDPTVEKLGEILAENPNGVLIYRDELPGWLAELDREGREGSRQFYLTAWNGTGRYTYDRIGRGTVEIDAACVSIIGGAQPGPLGRYVHRTLEGGIGDDGLLQRFQLAVWPDIPPEWNNVDRPPNRGAREVARSVYERLAYLKVESEADDGIPFLRFDGSAQEVFDEWRSRLERRLRSGEEHPAFEAHLSKYRSLVPALALICHLADSPEGGPVTEAAAVRALAWTEYLELHARRLYNAAVEAALAGARELDRHIQRGELESPFTAREVYRRGWRLLDRETTEEALECLSDFGRVRPETMEPGAAGGRPTTRWRVHPDILPKGGDDDGERP